MITVHVQHSCTFTLAVDALSFQPSKVLRFRPTSVQLTMWQCVTSSGSILQISLGGRVSDTQRGDLDVTAQTAMTANSLAPFKSPRGTMRGTIKEAKRGLCGA